MDAAPAKTSPTVTRQSSLSRFFHGASFFGRGLSFVGAHKSLWPWVVAPTLVSCAITVGGFWWAHRAAAQFVEAHAAGHWAIVAWFFRLMMWIFVLAVGLVAYLASTLIASAPFAGPLSVRVETLATGKPAPRERLGATLASCGHVLFAALIYLVCSAAIFVCQLAISPLAPFFGILGFFVTAKFLAYDNFDFPLTRRGVHFGAKWAWLGKFRAETYGFGSVVALLAFVPGLGLIVPAVAAAGATLLYLELEKS